MNAELKAKWLEALRSGKYKQGKGALRSAQNEFCCLGVLCDIVASDRWRTYAIIPAFTDLKNKTYYGAPPSDLYPEYNVEVDAPHAGTLISMNDNGKSFKEIAEYIEENL